MCYRKSDESTTLYFPSSCESLLYSLMDIRQSEIMEYLPKHPDNQKGHLKRVLGTFDVICMGFNCVVGAGIFLIVGQVQSLAGNGVFLVFPLCGLLCFFIALCFAEMAGIYGKTGGAYLYARDVFGPLIGFWVGWIMWISSIIGWASVASGFGFYVRYFLPEEQAWCSMLIVATSIAGLGSVNYFGIKLGAKVINFFTVGKLFSLLMFVGIGMFFVKKGNFTSLHRIENFNTAIIIALYAYTGFEFIGVPAGEMRNPQRDIPRILVFVFLIVTLFYATIQIVATGTFPGLATSEKPLADAAKYFLGPVGGLIIGIGALLSIGGSSAGIALTSPRSLYVLSKGGFFPELFSKIHPRYHTPHVAILVNTGLTLFLSITGSFKYLIAASVMVSILQYIPTCLAVIVLRKKRPDVKRTFMVSGGYCIPFFALVICCWLVYHVELKVIAATVFVIVVSLPLYFYKRTVVNQIET
ncbi:MAG: amino acid permease [Candidatus Brocadiaceae bacterium]|nr:amino acid permease [Candidatus Brocadiaceae bacterium]